MPSARSATSGRTTVVILGLVVAAALALFFIVADPLGLQSGLNRGGQEGGDPGGTPLDLGDDPSLNRGDGEVSLAGLYGAGDLGALRLRLLEVADRQPIRGETLRLVGRAGSETTATTGEDGVATFGNLAPGRRYQLEIKVEGHAPISMTGIKIPKADLNDLGDILLGKNVVVRGRVIDSSGRPLPGTSVSVFTPAGNFTEKGMFFSMAEQATSFVPALEAVDTDAEGWFILGTLEDGAYRLEARHGGYATRYENDVIVSGDRPARAMTIVLGEGATVTGHVKDDQGKPIAGARVMAIRDYGRRMGPSGMTLERDIALTDASGAYAIDTLRQGTRYRFGVIADGYASSYEMRGEAVEQKREEKDFVLVKGGSIEGRVLSKQDGRPVADAEILVMVGRMAFGRGGRRGGSGNSEDNKATAARARSDEQGFFTIEDVLPGPVMSAQVRAGGYVPFTASQWMGGESWGEVAGGEVLEVAPVELENGGTITGTVTDRNSGDPVVGASVMVMLLERPWQLFVSGAPQAQTGADGTFAITGVLPGEYGIRAVADGYAPGDAMAEENKVEVTEVGGVTKRDLGLERAGMVTGIVTNSVGEPIPGARVRTRISRRPAGESGNNNGNRRGRGGRRISQMLPGNSGSDLTDLDGRYIIDGVSSEEYWVVSADADEFVATESEAFRVQPGEEKEVDVILQGGGNLSGRVVDEFGGFVEGAVVRVGRLPPERATTVTLRAWEVDRYLQPNVYTTDAEGKFLATNIAPGRAIVKVEHDEYVTFYKRNVQIRSDETTENYIATLSKGDVMEGVVRGADGKPISGAFIGVTKESNPSRTSGEQEGEPSEDIEPQLFGRTDEDGKFKIEDITPGTVNVVVWFAPGYQSWRGAQAESAIVRDVSTSSKGIEFKLEPTAPGEGGMRGPGGRR